MKIKISELQGAALDWAVAKSEGIDFAENGWSPFDVFLGARVGGHHRYSEDWTCGGPIIERERISTNYDASGRWSDGWRAFSNNAPIHLGPTPLIAAMRCYVSSKLGDEVEVPNELLQPR